MPTTIEGVTFYTLQEAAQALQVTSNTMRRYVHDGTIKSQRIGNRIYITKGQLLRFLKPSIKADKEGERLAADEGKK